MKFEASVVPVFADAAATLTDEARAKLEIRKKEIPLMTFYAGKDWGFWQGFKVLAIRRTALS